MFFVLVLVDVSAKERIQAAGILTSSTDLDFQIPPRWPPEGSLVIEEGTYVLSAVPLTSISLVTERTVKVCTCSLYDSVHLLMSTARWR